MKRKFLFFALLVVSVVMALMLSSCERIVIPGVTDQNNGGNQGSTTYTVSYRFNNETVLTHEVDATTGLLTDAQKKEIREFEPSGFEDYTFTGFYQDSAKTSKFDLDKKITGNIYVYCQLLLEVNYHYGDQIIETQKVDALNGYLTTHQKEIAKNLGVNSSRFTSLYTMDGTERKAFDTEALIAGNTDVFCELIYVVDYRFNGTFFHRQRVDSLEGFTEQHLKERDELLFNGFRVDYFYADESQLVEFDFDEPLVADTVIHCGRNPEKAGDNITWKILESGEGDNKKVTLVFEGTGPMYEFYRYDTDVPWRSYYTTITDIVIPEGITTIADYAFYEFNQIDTVVLPETLTYIGKNAFFESSISDINFPDSLRTIGNNAFNGCLGLVHLNFNPGLEYINEGAFQKCKNIVTVVLTDTIMRFGTSAFQECYSITSAYYIGTEEQYDKIIIQVDNFWIDSLAHTYFISDEMPAEPGPYWYYDENGDIAQWYYTIWYMEKANSKVPFIVDYVDTTEGITQRNIDFMNAIVFNGYRYAGWKESGKTYTMTVGTILTEDIKLFGDRGNICGDNLVWNIRGSVLYINKKDSKNADGAMWDFKYYHNAPWYGKAITRVEIGSGVTYIGSFAFADIIDKNSEYSSFSYLDIPISVTAIHRDAIYGCDHLLYIYYAGTDLDLYGDENTDPKITGLVEIDQKFALRVYTNASGISFSTLKEGAYWARIRGEYNGKSITRRVAWDYADGVLKVGGGDADHIMLNYNSHSDTPWYSYRDEVTKVIIIDNIHTIGHRSFENMSSVVSITVPRRLAKTSASAFVGTGYYNTEYAKGVVYLYTTAEGTTSNIIYGHLLKVNPDKVSEVFIIPEKTLSIAEQAFEGCSNVKKLFFTKDIGPKSVYSTALSGFTGLEGIYFDGNPEAWPNYENANNTGAEVYYYSATQPADGSSEVKYWHWNEAKTEPIAW